MITQTPSGTNPDARSSRAADGFSLPEVLIAMGIMLVVLAGTFSAMSQAMNAQHVAKQITGMNGNLRTSMDLVNRDLLQVGQGLPVGRRIGVPNGAGATVINRPGPAAAGGCAGATTFPAQPSLPALTVGPDLGPMVNGVCTDVLTTIAADGGNNLSLNVTSIAADGRSLTIHPSILIADDPDAQGDNLRAGDLVMVAKGSTSVLMQVTAVAGQTLTFGTGADDPLGLNQFGAPGGMLGTINRLKAEAPADSDVPLPNVAAPNMGPSSVARIRMVTYFVNPTVDPTSPRLMRVVNGGTANVVGFDVQSMRLTFDIANGTTNPAGVRMVAADLTAGGACAPSTCSENQIRTVNVVLAMRSHEKSKQTADYHRNTLFTQVSMRNLAFVDRYP